MSRRLPIIAAVLAAVLAAMVVWLVTDDPTASKTDAAPTSSAATGPTSSTTTTFPVDPEVAAAAAELQAYVAAARGLDFKHDVGIRLLDDTLFEAQVDAFFQFDNSSIAATAAYYEALGLIPEGTAEAYAELIRERYRSILGFYDSDVNVIVARGTQMSAGVSTVVIHELVHALDDQWFGFDRPGYAADRTSERETTFPMVIEGNATRIENQWIDELPPDLQAEAREYVGSDPSGKATDSADFLDFGILAPYRAGTPFVTGLADSGGKRAVDGVLVDPPETTEQVMFPEVFERREGRVRLAPPPAGGPVIDEGVVGALFWSGLLTYAESGVDDDTADAAVRGWGGDWQVTWNEGAVTCTRADVVGDTDDDTAELSAALHQWAATLPEVSVQDVDGRVRMEVCYVVPSASSAT